MPALKHDTADYQRAVGDFVQREVMCCASHIVESVGFRLPPGHASRPDLEDWLHLFRREPDRDDCENQAGVEFRETKDGWQWRSKAQHIDWDDTTSTDCVFDDLEDAVCDAANECDVEGSEVFEHWIVSDFLARKLAERGEVIERNFYGLTIWGRATTGQARSMDWVICQIYDALHAND